MMLERLPIGDTVDGFLLRLGTTTLLSDATHPTAETLASGPFITRYGLRFLGKLHQSIVPGLVVMDYGDLLNGDDAWDFLLKHSNLHPRAEVVGYRNDGTDDMCFLRVLDLAVPPEVLLYTAGDDRLPMAKPSALITSDPQHFPARVTTYLPTYASIADWQAAHE